MNTNSPYTYLIGWSAQNLWYYGVRFAKECSPNDLWESYFTSSKKVRSLRKRYGEPDVIQVRKVFTDNDKAREWETKVIKRMNAVTSDKWINLTDNTDKFYHEGPRGSFSPEHRRKLSEAKKGKKISKEHAKKLHEGRRNSKNSKEHTEALRKSRLGTKHSEYAKKIMSEVRMNNPDRFAQASEAGKISAAKRRNNKEYSRSQSERMKMWWKERKEKLNATG